jgi:hypothetical protein
MVTLAERIAQLGGIPPDRVRLSPLPGTATEDDLIVARKPICELIDGALVDKPGYCYESVLTVEIASRILDVVHDARLGVVMGTSGLGQDRGRTDSRRGRDRHSVVVVSQQCASAGRAFGGLIPSRVDP